MVGLQQDELQFDGSGIKLTIAVAIINHWRRRLPNRAAALTSATL
jgi:hypothetical protein